MMKKIMLHNLFCYSEGRGKKKDGNSIQTEIKGFVWRGGMEIKKKTEVRLTW